MYPEGFHPVQTAYKRDYSGLADYLPRSAVGVKYYFADFGISVHVADTDRPSFVTGNLGRDRDPPELSATVPYDPFKLDVFIIGNMFRQKFCDVIIPSSFVPRRCSHSHSDSPTSNSFGPLPIGWPPKVLGSDHLLRRRCVIGAVCRKESTRSARNGDYVRAERTFWESPWMWFPCMTFPCITLGLFSEGFSGNCRARLCEYIDPWEDSHIATMFLNQCPKFGSKPHSVARRENDRRWRLCPMDVLAMGPEHEEWCPFERHTFFGIVIQEIIHPPSLIGNQRSDK